LQPKDIAEFIAKEAQRKRESRARKKVNVEPARAIESVTIVL